MPVEELYRKAGFQSSQRIGQLPVANKTGNRKDSEQSSNEPSAPVESEKPGKACSGESTDLYPADGSENCLLLQRQNRPEAARRSIFESLSYGKDYKYREAKVNLTPKVTNVSSAGPGDIPLAQVLRQFDCVVASL